MAFSIEGWTGSPAVGATDNGIAAIGRGKGFAKAATVNPLVRGDIASGVLRFTAAERAFLHGGILLLPFEPFQPLLVSQQLAESPPGR